MAVPTLDAIGTIASENNTSSAEVDNATHSDGDLLIIFINSEGTGAPSTWDFGTQGGSATDIVNADYQSAGHIRIAYKIAASEPSAYTVAFGANRDWGGRIVAISGHDGTTPVDQIETLRTGSSNNPNTLGVTVDDNDNLVIAWHAAQGIGLILTADTGWTLTGLFAEAYGSGGDRVSMLGESKEVDSAASGTTAPDGAGGSYEWAAAQFAVQPSTQVFNNCVAAPAGTSSVTATLETFKDLTAAPVGLSTTTADLKHVVKLGAATAAGTSTVTADLYAASANNMEAAPTGASTVTADLKHIVEMAATAAGASAATADLDAIVDLIATVTGLSTVTADLKHVVEMVATSAGTSTATADLKHIVELVATSAGASTVTATLDNQAPAGQNDMVAAPAGTSSVTADLKHIVELAATSAGTSSTTADLKHIVELAATTAGASTVTAALELFKDLTATSGGASAVTAALELFKDLSATAAGASSVSATLTNAQQSADLAATAAGVSAGSSTLKVFKDLQASIAGLSTIAANLSVPGIFGGATLGRLADQVSISEAPAGGSNVSEQAGAAVASEA